MLGALLALSGCSTEEPDDPSQASAPPAAAVAVPPLETSYGLAWLTAACGGPSVGDASPNSWLPGAKPVVLCVTPPGRVGVLVGVYDDAATAAADMDTIGREHGYANRVDDAGRTWVFVADAPDPGPLTPLEQFDFVLS